MSSSTTVAITSEKAEAKKNDGNKLFKEGKYTKALKKYEQASDIDPTCAVYWCNMAACHEKLRDLTLMKKTAERCVELDPTSVKGYYRLATAYSCLCKYNNMLSTIEKGLTVQPQNSDLLKSKQTAEREIHLRKLSKKVRILTMKSDLPYLGGCYNSGDNSNAAAANDEDKSHDDAIRLINNNNNIPKDSAYSKLPRPRLPPPMHNKDKRHFNDDEAKKAFFTLYYGDFDVTWFFLDKDDEQSKLMRIEAYLPDDQNNNDDDFIDWCPIMRINFMIFVDGQKLKTVCSYITEMNQKYHRSLTGAQKESLSCRIVHRFLRNHGASMNINLSKAIFDWADGRYTDGGWYKDSVDLLLARSDIACNSNAPDAALWVFETAEAMEAAKLFRDAANIYVDIYNNKFSPHPSVGEVYVRGCAGLAFKRAGDYVRAEKEYVETLKAAGDWNMADLHISNNLQNMMIFYEIVHRSVVAGLHDDDAHRQMDVTFKLLIGLLSIAGFHGKGCTLFDHKEHFQGYLKRQYRVPSGALRALKEATSSPNMTKYRQTILRCKKDNLLLCTTPDPDGESADEFRKYEKHKAKEGARDLKCSGTKVSMHHFSMCSQCDQAMDDPKHCPCKTARYCSKDCQVAHWPSHKNVCPVRKKKNTEKKKDPR